MGSLIAVAVLTLVVIAVLVLISLYNRFVRLRNRADNAWAQVDVQLRRRYDLVPNLVETVKGYATHERETFERVTQARAAGIQAQSVEDQGKAENMLTSALRQMFAVAEAYPELHANENFRDLQNELAEIEQQILISRQIYNDTVLSFNNAVQTFPGVLLAGSFGFRQRPYFEIEDASREPARVDFSDMPGRQAPPAAPSSDVPQSPQAPTTDPGRPPA